MAKNEPKNFCHHVLSSGNLCNAVPLRDQNFCYFHMMTRARLRRLRLAVRNNRPLQIGVLEDTGAIQLALVDLSNAVLSGTVDPSRGYLVLQALQTAARNIIATTDFNDCKDHFLEFHDEHLNDGSEPDERDGKENDEAEDSEDTDENETSDEAPKIAAASAKPSSAKAAS
jgi:hypothetical protein